MPIMQRANQICCSRRGFVPIIYLYIYSISYIKGPIYTGCPENFCPIYVATVEELLCLFFHSWYSYIGKASNL